MIWLYWLALVLCLSLTVLLALIKCSSRGWLSAFMGFLTAYVGLMILDSQTFYISPKLYLCFLAVVYLPGPLVLGYVSHISTRSEVHLKDFTLCLLPIVTAFLVGGTMGDYGFFEIVDQSAYQTPQYVIIFNIISAMAGLHFLLYMIRASTLIFVMRKDWASYQSQTLPSSWYDMIYFEIVILVATIMQVASAFLNPAGSATSIGDVGFMVLVWFFIYLSFKSALEHIGVLSAKKNQTIPDTNAYLTAEAQHMEGSQAGELVLEKIKSNQLFLLEDLSLAKLSEQLQMSPHQVSDMINSQFNKSFYEFINDMRIEYAADMLLKDPKKSITEVFYTAGFTTKSTFYSYFKKAYGCTPTEYRKAV